MDLDALALPAAPPREVQLAVEAAAVRAAELSAAGWELHFSGGSGRGVVVEVRAQDGRVLRTLRPSQALDVMAGLLGPWPAAARGSAA